MYISGCRVYILSIFLKVISNVVCSFSYLYDFQISKVVYSHSVRICSRHVVGFFRIWWRHGRVPMSRGEPPRECRKIPIYFLVCGIIIGARNWWTCPLRISGYCEVCYYVPGSLRIYKGTSMDSLTIFSFIFQPILVNVYALYRFHFVSASLSIFQAIIIQPCHITRTTMTLLWLRRLARVDDTLYVTDTNAVSNDHVDEIEITRWVSSWSVRQCHP